ncbi:DNA-directed RNA polymerase subunit K [Candidatus Woesearchaeota archaeon]|nr:DNA-directed RNA polymerase subunit K [Candidatus Woesearchaeota archaeon]
MEQQFTKYELARILGARALQLSMNAPMLIKIKKEDLEKINYDALKIAEIELNSNVLPISVKRPMPVKKEEKLKRVKMKIVNPEEENNELKEEKELINQAEIMELANPEDESEEENEESEIE